MKKLILLLVVKITIGSLWSIDNNTKQIYKRNDILMELKIDNF